MPRTDSILTVFTNLPAADSTVHTQALDTKQADPGAATDFIVELFVPATTTLVSGKQIVFVLQDSDDGVTFSDTDPSISTTIIGQTGNGSQEKRIRFRLPLTARRYVRFAISAENGAGDNTATQIAFRLLA